MSSHQDSPAATAAPPRLSSLQRDLARKDARLAKATSRAAKLEGLLMQTEDEAAQLRAQHARNASELADARRGERDARDALADAERLLAAEEGAAERREGELRGLVERAQEEARRREVEAEDRERAWEAEVGVVLRQVTAQEGLLEEEARLNVALKAKLADATLEVYNARSVLKETRFDAEVRATELQAELDFKKREAETVNALLKEKAESVTDLSIRSEAVESKLVEREAQLKAVQSELTAAESSLETVCADMERGKEKCAEEAAELRKALSVKADELAKAIATLSDRESFLLSQIEALETKNEQLDELLAGQQDDACKLRSRLESSQQALTLLQRQLSQSTTATETNIQALKDIIRRKEAELQSVTASVAAQETAHGEKLNALTNKLTLLISATQDKDAALAALEEREANLREINTTQGAQLMQKDEDHKSALQRLRTAIIEKEAEVADLKCALDARTCEAERLAHEAAGLKENLSQKHEEEKLFTSLEAHLHSTQADLTTARSFSDELSQRLEVSDTIAKERESEILGLRKEMNDLSEKYSEQQTSLQSASVEKDAHEQRLAAQKLELEQSQTKLTETTVALEAIKVEQAGLTGSIEELKQASFSAVREAQEDAAKEIADLVIAREDLEDSLNAKSAEVTRYVERMKDMQLRLSEVEIEADKSKEALQTANDFRSQCSDLQANLATAQQALEQKEQEFVEMRTRQASAENLLEQQLVAKQSTITSQQITIEQHRKELSELASSNEACEQSIARMKAAILDSGSVVEGALRENERLVSSQDLSNVEFRKALDDLTTKLKATQQSADVWKSSYHLLFNRLKDLHIASGPGSGAVDTSPDNDTKEALHDQTNLIIVELEEHLHGGRYLEAEVLRLGEALAESEKSVERLCSEKRELHESYTDMRGNLAELEKNLHALSIKEQSTDDMVHGYKEQLETISSKLFEQERATEITLSALKLQLDEKDVDVKKMASRYDEVVEQSDTLSRCLHEKSEEVERTLAQLQVLSDRHQQTVDEARSNLERAELSSKLKAEELEESACALQALRESSSRSVQEAENAALELQKNETEALRCKEEAEQSASEMSERLHSLSQKKQTLEADLAQSKNELSKEILSAKELKEEIKALRDELRVKEEAVQKSDSDVKRLNSLIVSLKDDLTTQSDDFDSKLQAVRDEAEAQYALKAKEADERMRLRFEEASKNENATLGDLKRELQDVEEARGVLQEEAAQLSTRLAQLQASKEAEISDLKSKLDGALTAYDSVKGQTETMKVAIDGQVAEKEELCRRIETAEQEVRDRERTVLSLEGKLSAASTSLAALEEKVVSMSQALADNSKEYDAAIDSLCTERDNAKTELKEALQAQKTNDVMTEKRLAEIERLERVLEQKDEQNVSWKDQIAGLEKLICAKEEEMEQEKAYREKNYVVAEKFASLSDERERLEAALASQQAMVSQKESEVDKLASELEFTRNDLTNRNNVVEKLETKSEQLVVESQELRDQLNSTQQQRAAEARQLLAAEASVRKLTEQVELHVQAQQSASPPASSDKLESDMSDMLRRHQKWGQKMKKLQRKLKKLEKLLYAEKQKVLSAEQLSAKRQVSPSTKGMSPSMKKLRNVERREPLSPLGSNARPPVAPRSAARTHLTF